MDSYDETCSSRLKLNTPGVWCFSSSLSITSGLSLKIQLMLLFCSLICLRVNGDCVEAELLCSAFTLCYGMQSVAIEESTIHLWSLCGWGRLAVKLSLTESHVMRVSPPQSSNLYGRACWQTKGLHWDPTLCIYMI